MIYFILKSFPAILIVIFTFIIMLFSGELKKSDQVVDYILKQDKQLLYGPITHYDAKNFKTEFLCLSLPNILIAGSSRVMRISNKEVKLLQKNNSKNVSFFNGGGAINSYHEIYYFFDLINECAKKTGKKISIIYGPDFWHFNQSNKLFGKKKIINNNLFSEEFLTINNFLARNTNFVIQIPNILKNLKNQNNCPYGNTIGLNAILHCSGFDYEGVYHYPPKMNELKHTNPKAFKLSRIIEFDICYRCVKELYETIKFKWKYLDIYLYEPPINSKSFSLDSEIKYKKYIKSLRETFKKRFFACNYNSIEKSEYIDFYHPAQNNWRSCFINRGNFL